MKYKNTRRQKSWCNDGIYSSFFDMICGFFNDATCCFVINKLQSWKRTKSAEKRGISPLLVLPLMMKFLGKGITREGEGYNNTNNMDKKGLVALYPLKKDALDLEIC